MIIEKDKVVRFKYQLSDTDNQVLEKTDDKVPMAYLHGHNNLMAGLEKAMEGRQVADQFVVTLAPEDAYGEIKPDQEQRVPIKHLQGAKKWKKGMIGVVHTEQGRRQVKIVKVGKFMATADFNHPFAGKTLTFDVEVVDIRDATTEELVHGHAHGDGGHHH